ncbi:MAG: hypothetical protein KDA80_04595 [Planctomycetaceae bacterium]|nr:hypothetical protein [Planctomycetaceae bacterium]
MAMTLVATVVVAAILLVVASLGAGLLPVERLRLGSAWTAIPVAAGISVVVAGVLWSFLGARELSSGVILTATLVRPALTLLFAAGLAGVFAGLRTPVFFLSLAVLYLVNLAIETFEVLRPIASKSKGMDQHLGAPAS